MNTHMPTPTVQLSNGLTILAKPDGTALRYGNRTMAQKKSSQLLDSDHMVVDAVPLQVGTSFGSALTYGYESSHTPLSSGFYVEIRMMSEMEVETEQDKAVQGLQEAVPENDGRVFVDIPEITTPEREPVLGTGKPISLVGLVYLPQSLARKPVYTQTVSFKIPFATVSGPREDPGNRHNHRNQGQTDRPYAYAT